MRSHIRKISRYVCNRCGKDCRGKGKSVVNHIKPRTKFPHLALEPSNLELVCTECHNKVCSRDDKNPNRGASNKGIPNDPTSAWSNY
ncbi:HNH endonuclease [Vibrio breoganii]|uniref:HNH endonuclease n=1 Tax=Vibrio breoganii TaxID=553239 RepID=UPI0039B01322